MKVKSQTKYLFMIALLSIVIAGMLLYQALYNSTATALRRAESFLFSRMTVNRPGEQGRNRHFYVSNRLRKIDEGSMGERLGNRRSAKLNFGIVDTKIQPSVGLGRFINPSEWFQNEEIRIVKLETLSNKDFVEQLRVVVANSPLRSLLVVVHGFRERFQSAMRKTAFVGHILDINSPIMLFDWPGDQGLALSGYRRARAVATESGAEFAQTLQLLLRDVQPERLWLLANSMGAQVAVEAFGHLSQNPEFADTDIEIEDVLLTAPDVSHEDFNERFKQQITALTRQLTIYVSSNDRALVMSRIINRDARRGASTLSPDMLEEAINVAGLVDPDSDAITLVDVTPVNRTRNFHNFSLETPEFFDDLFLRLTSRHIPPTRGLYRLQTPDGSIYWVLTPGR